jgi:hypothetical protein
MDLSNILQCCSKNDQGRSRSIEMLKKYCELNIAVRGRSEHCIDLISEMQKVLGYLLSTRWDVDISLCQSYSCKVFPRNECLAKAGGVLLLR